MIPKPIAVGIAVAITVVWLAANLISMAAQLLGADDVPVDGQVHVIFLVIVGGMLGLSRKGSDSGPDGDATGPDSGADTPPPESPRRGGGAHRALLLLGPWRTA